jgi:hypothetical protein
MIEGLAILVVVALLGLTIVFEFLFYSEEQQTLDRN